MRLKLTGERAIDVADASGTLLLDVARRRWSDEVLDALEIEREWLPTVLESPEVVGAHAGRACRSRPARATRRPAGSAWAWTGRGR